MSAIHDGGGELDLLDDMLFHVEVFQRRVPSRPLAEIGEVLAFREPGVRDTVVADQRRMGPRIEADSTYDRFWGALLGRRGQTPGGIVRLALLQPTAF